MTCTNGHEVPSNSAFCPTCGVAAAPVPPPVWPSQGVVSTTPPAAVPVVSTQQALVAPGGQTVAVLAAPVEKRGLYTAAAVINWVVFGILVVSTLGIGVIFGAWFIPMTIRMHKGAAGPYRHTSLGVCTLLFCNLISGILILVDDSGRPAKPKY